MNEVELLFTEVLNCDRLSLYQNRSLYLGKAKSALLALALKRRIKGEPLQYILGKQEFMGLEFKVGRGVFIPRPETEILVEAVIRYLSAIRYPLSAIRILDLGTGCGSIAVSLAKFLPIANVTAIDISYKALEIARHNAIVNKVIDKISFIHGDLFNPYHLTLATYPLIISNPPYIPTAEIESLQPELKYEPRIALDGGKDGLDFYRGIIEVTPRYLEGDGFLIMEMGFNQRGEIENIFQKSGNFEIIEVVKDYNNIDRVIVARLVSNLPLASGLRDLR